MTSKTHRLTPFYIFVSAVAFLFMVAVAPSLLAVDDAQTHQAQSKSAAPQDGEQWQPLKPLAEHPRTSINVVEQLRRNHYIRKPIDDELSSQMFDKFLGMLDGNRSYFLASDILHFLRLRLTVDNAL